MDMEEKEDLVDEEVVDEEVDNDDDVSEVEFAANALLLAMDWADAESEEFKIAPEAEVGTARFSADEVDGVDESILVELISRESGANASRTTRPKHAQAESLKTSV